MATDDSLLRARPKSTLLADVVKPPPAHAAVLEPPEDSEPESSAFDDATSLPLPGSPYDATHARASNKPVATLRFVMGDTIRGLPYCNCDSIDWVVADKPGASPVIVIRFAGLVPCEAIVAGRHLLKLYDLLSHHRIAWVRELPKGKDFMGQGRTVITGITIRPITEVSA